MLGKIVYVGAIAGIVVCIWAGNALAAISDANTVATWYGPGLELNPTASGDVFEPYTELTAAHRDAPFGSKFNVCYDGCVEVEITDRGPYGNAEFDLSELAARKIDMKEAGIAPIYAERIE